MKKFEFSKVILAVVAVATIVIVTVSFILMWETRDLSPLSYIISGIFAELASATGFYYWKARRENEIKLSKIYGVDEPVDEPVDKAVDEPKEPVG